MSLKSAKHFLRYVSVSVLLSAKSSNVYHLLMVMTAFRKKMSLLFLSGGGWTRSSGTSTYPYVRGGRPRITRVRDIACACWRRTLRPNTVRITQLFAV